MEFQVIGWLIMDKIWMPQWLKRLEEYDFIPQDKDLHVDLPSVVKEDPVENAIRRIEAKPLKFKSAAKTRLTQIIEQTLDSALVLEGSILDNQDQAISVWTGSAFLIQPNIAITNSHTVVEPDTATGERALHIASLDGENFYEIKSIARDEGVDISVFEILDFPGHSYLTLGDSDSVELGEMIVILGAPEGWSNTTTVGYITNKYQSLEGGDPAWQDLIFTDAYIANGSSGGAVVDINGTVIGVVVGIVGQHSSIGVGVNALIPINKVKTFLSQNNIPYEG